MGRAFDQIRALFPTVANDPQFKITSPKDRDYNCLAWALSVNDMWIWPGNGDDDDFWWPEGVALNCEESTFVKAYEQFGFQRCATADLEAGYEKIALYSLNGEATHAARLMNNGLWTSKLGWWEDVQHSSPATFEGDFYGTVYCYMKRPIQK